MLGHAKYLDGGQINNSIKVETENKRKFKIFDPNCLIKKSFIGKWYYLTIYSDLHLESILELNSEGAPDLFNIIDDFSKGYPSDSIFGVFNVDDINDNYLILKTPFGPIFAYNQVNEDIDRKSTRLNSSHYS